MWSCIFRVTYQIHNSTFLLYQGWVRYPCLNFLKLKIFNCGVSTKLTCAFLVYENQARIIRIKHFSLFFTLFLENLCYLSHFLWDKVFKGNVVNLMNTVPGDNIDYKENRIYIRVEFRKSLGMNFVSPFQPEREFKVYKSVNVHKLYAVEYINTVCSLGYPFQFRIF